MRNRAALVLAALAVLGSAACSPDGQGAAGQSAPATVGSASADVPPAAGGTSVQPAFTENPDGTINRSGGPRPATSGSTVTAGGLGPYQVGVAVGELRAAGLVTRIAPIKGCAGYTGAIGAHRYHSPDLVFYQGRLLHLTVDSARVAIDKGVQVGTRAANVRGRYPGGKQLDDWAGNSAWLAVQGDYALLFAMKNGKVTRVQAGMAEPLQFKFTDNQGC